MRGSIANRGPGTWEMRVYRGQVDGKKKYRTRTFKGGKRAAETALRAFIEEVEEEEAPPPRRRRAGPTVGDALERWWSEEGSRLATASTARGHIDVHLMPRLGDVPLAKLKGRAAGRGEVSLTVVYASMTTVATGKPLSPAYVARIHTTLRSALGHAVAAGLVEHNAAATAKKATVTQKRSTTPQAPEMAAFMARVATESPRLHAWLCLVGSGARPVEVHALRWSAVDFATGRLRLEADGVVRTKGGGPERGVELRTGATHKRRVRDITLDGYTLQALALFRERCSVWPGSALIFHNGDGERPMYPTWAYQAFQRVATRARAAGLELAAGFRPYDLRHFLASQALAAGVGAPDLAARMGNTVSTVSRYYAHALTKGDQRIATVMGDLYVQNAS